MRAIAEQCHERPVQLPTPPAVIVSHDFRHALFCKVNRHRYLAFQTMVWMHDHPIMYLFLDKSVHVAMSLVKDFSRFQK
jgi:hypothetical protein